jgi:hypothetical protein
MQKVGDGGIGEWAKCDGYVGVEFAKVKRHCSGVGFAKRPGSRGAGLSRWSGLGNGASVSIGAGSFELAETAAVAFVPASSNGTFPPGALFGRLQATL